MDCLADILIPPLPKPYTYLLPEALSSQLSVGCRIDVPLGARKRASGYITAKYPATAEKLKLFADFKLKAVAASAEFYPVFLPSQLPFFSWIAEYYCQSLSSVIDTAVPPAASLRYDRFVTISNGDPSAAGGPLQKELIKELMSHPEAMPYQQLLKKYRGATQALKRLHSRGVVEITARPKQDSFKTVSAPAWAKRQVELNSAQSAAYEQIKRAVLEPKFETFLMHGVTGSGKTEIYIEAIQLARQQGKGSLVVVPEIALTPQLINRFAARVGGSIAVLHSGLGKRERWLAWQMLLEGRCHTAIGARSGIFAPIENLGLIIVDEEHDSSYKQSDSLRYNARDLAVVRGRLARCPVVLGSATPALESYYNAQRQKYRYLPLPLRHSSASQVKVDIVDLQERKPWEMKSRNVSPELHSALENALKNREQAFILYNRRGFASFLQCDTCQKVLECPNCSVTLTYHKKINLLRCHYCDYQCVPPDYCPDCNRNAPKGETGRQAPPGKFVHRGAGTERIYEELQKLFPEARLDRLDSDAAGSSIRLNAILERVRSGATDILVGTQMIAKGHDLPGVTLVGVIDCDVGLHLPDFRASERVFQLLTQASGRAGRSSAPGQVILQTRVPLHPSLLKTVEKDFAGYAAHELANRRLLNYPPFTRILRIVAGSPDPVAPLKVLQEFRARIAALTADRNLSLAVLGPAEAPLRKLRAHWRWHLLLKSKRASHLQAVLQTLKGIAVKPKSVRLAFDLDPQDLL